MIGVIKFMISTSPNLLSQCGCPLLAEVSTSSIGVLLGPDSREIIIMSLFKEDNIFSASTNLTYGPHKTWLNTYYLQTVKIYIYKIIQDTLKLTLKYFQIKFFT